MECARPGAILRSVKGTQPVLDGAGRTGSQHPHSIGPSPLGGVKALLIKAAFWPQAMLGSSRVARGEVDATDLREAEMGLIFARATNATFTIFLSFVLSYIMLIAMGILWPEGLDWLVQRAKEVEAMVVRPGIPVRYKVWLDLLIEEGAILLLFFTMVARILVAIVGTALSSPFKKH